MVGEGCSKFSSRTISGVDSPRTNMVCSSLIAAIHFGLCIRVLRLACGEKVTKGKYKKPA